MAEAAGQSNESNSLRFARFIVRNRAVVASLLIAASLFFVYPILNMISSALGTELPGPIVRIDTKARDLFPDHPYIHAQDKYASEFGGSSAVAVAVVVVAGRCGDAEARAANRCAARADSSARA